MRQAGQFLSGLRLLKAFVLKSLVGLRMNPMAFGPFVA
jgi:hypothetical protein